MKTIYMVGFAADTYALGVLKNRRPELTLHYSERYISDAEKQIKNDSEQVKRLVRILIPEQGGSLPDAGVVFLENYEHGVFEGLYVLAGELKAGFRISGEELPIRQFGLEMSEFTDVNPFEQKSSGFIFVSEKTIEELISEAGPEAAEAASDCIRKIGYITKNPAKIIVGFAAEKDGAPVERNLNRPGMN